MLVIGHRGASGFEPENTIRSLKKAIEHGVKMVELDIRVTRDGELVLFHDRTLKRLFDDGQAIAKRTLAELRAISRYRLIPTLDEALAAIDVDVNIEIKVQGIEQKVLNKIKNFPHRVLISSFYPGVLKKIRALDGKVHLGLIIPVRKFYFLPIMMQLTRNLQLYSIHPRNLFVTDQVVKYLRKFAKNIYVWTVNSEKELKRMKKIGVDGIFTDYPGLIK